MYKFYNIFFLLFFSHSTLVAKEPFLATLVNVVSNDIQEFNYGNIRFSCYPFGVISLDEIYRKADDNSSCKESIAKFYIKQRNLKYFSHSKFKIYQLYSLDIKENNRCTINVAGRKTFSELLLDEGLAVKEPLLKNREYESYFDKAEQKARENKKGLWNSNITKDCAGYFYTNQE